MHQDLLLVPGGLGVHPVYLNEAKALYRARTHLSFIPHQVRAPRRIGPDRDQGDAVSAMPRSARFDLHRWWTVAFGQDGRSCEGGLAEVERDER